MEKTSYFFFSKNGNSQNILPQLLSLKRVILRRWQRYIKGKLSLLDARGLSMFFLNTAFNQIINQFLVTFPVKITAVLDSCILNWVVYITLLKLSGLNSSFFIYYNCKLARLSLFKMSSLRKGQLPWIFFFAFERWKIKEKLPAKLGRINTRTMHSWQKK